MKRGQRYLLGVCVGLGLFLCLHVIVLGQTDPSPETVYVQTVAGDLCGVYQDIIDFATLWSNGSRSVEMLSYHREDYDPWLNETAKSLQQCLQENLAAAVLASPDDCVPFLDATTQYFANTQLNLALKPEYDVRTSRLVYGEWLHMINCVVATLDTDISAADATRFDLAIKEEEVLIIPVVRDTPLTLIFPDGSQIVRYPDGIIRAYYGDNDGSKAYAVNHFYGVNTAGDIATGSDVVAAVVCPEEMDSYPCTHAINPDSATSALSIDDVLFAWSFEAERKFEASELPSCEGEDTCTVYIVPALMK